MINRIDYQKFVIGVDHPTTEQLALYRDDLTTLVHTLGKGVRRLAQYPGVDFMIGPVLEDWTVANRDGTSELERDRQYSARCTDRGELHHMQVAETHTIRQRDLYERVRRLYRFTWQDPWEVFEAQALTFHIKTSARSIMRDATEGVLAMSQEAEGTVRTAEFGATSSADLDVLRMHTHEYAEALHARRDIPETSV